MKLIVCGDSFMSADTFLPNTHFSEILKTYGYNVTNLARGGISNTGIAFQLEKALTLKPDAIVFSSTSSERIDLVIKDFDSSKGLKNFIYPYVCDSSTGSEHVGGLDAAILSDVIVAFLTSRPDLPIELQNVVDSDFIKQYISLFHDANFKKILDTWLIGYWKYKLTENQIPFVHLYNDGPVGQHMYCYVRQNPTLVNQCVYHTDQHTQKLMAEELNVELKRLLNL
jgi:hypothetical protein